MQRITGNLEHQITAQQVTIGGGVFYDRVKTDPTGYFPVNNVGNGKLYPYAAVFDSSLQARTSSETRSSNTALTIALYI